MYTMAKDVFHNLIDSSINMATNHNTTAKSSLISFLGLVSEACQTSTSVRVFIGCHWSACTGSPLAKPVLYITGVDIVA